MKMAIHEKVICYLFARMRAFLEYLALQILFSMIQIMYLDRHWLENWEEARL